MSSFALPKPSRLWKLVPFDERLEAARAFWTDADDVTSQAEAVNAVALHLKFRPRSVLALPVEKRARYLLALPAVSDSLAARLLVSYHLAHQRPMMGAFLDALGIAHDHGLITDEVQLPEDEKIQAAARDLLQKYPGEDAPRYFATLLIQDPDAWQALEPVLAGE